MSYPVLEIAENAAAVIGIETLGSLVGNSSDHARSMLVLLNRSGRVLSQVRNEWGSGWVTLTRQWEFETVPDQAEYALPEDFDELIDGTVWDRSQYREARGTLSPQEWQTLRSGLVETVRISPYYRLRRNTAGTGRSLFLEPTPTEIEDLVLEYVSRHWLRSADSLTQHERVQADTDVPLFDGDLVEMDLLWRWKQSRGLSFAAELAEFELERGRRLKTDTGQRVISLGRRTRRYGYNVPESGFGGVRV